MTKREQIEKRTSKAPSWVRKFTSLKKNMIDRERQKNGKKNLWYQTSKTERPKDRW